MNAVLLHREQVLRLHVAVDEAGRVGRVQPARGTAGEVLAKDLGGGPDRSLALLFRSILELTIAELERSGTPVRHVSVMSGFRTPSYNETGGDPSGRAALSRHMYGDAADIFIDNDGNGSMDDLDGDRRVNLRDARVIEECVNRVERAYPALIGGTGIYPGTSAHGPFIHIDTRGFRARW